VSSLTSAHPQVEVSIGGQLLTRIPPKYLKNFVLNSSQTSISTFQLNFIDPTFGDLELELMDLVRRQISQQANPISTSPDYARFQFRFGFPEHDLWNPGHDDGDWYYGHILRALPRITNAGILLSIEGKIGHIAPKPMPTSFFGRRSDVVKTIAEFHAELQTPEIWDTNDDPREWPAMTPSQDHWDYVVEQLLPGAESTLKQYTGGYAFTLRGNGRKLYFGPVLHAPGASSEFRLLVRQSPEILDFSPDIDAFAVGNLAGTGAVMRAYNPLVKEYRKMVSSPIGSKLVIDDPLSQQIWSKTGEVPLDTVKALADADKISEEEARERVEFATKLRYAFLNTDLAEAERLGKQAWEELYWRMRSGTTRFYGTPKTLGMVGGDHHHYIVELPNGRVHWTSGYWRVAQASHRIENSYTIDAQVKKITTLTEAGA